MQRVLLTLRVRPEKRTAYLEAHKHVWPELIETAQRAGLRNHSVFMRGDDLVLYAEAQDMQASLAEYLASDVKRRWDVAMEPFFDPAAGGTGQWEEVFHFD
jgi:L-rhamnose mutarotase